MSACPFCQHPNPREARFCSACGSSLTLELCPHCGKANDRLAAHCEFCGAIFTQPPADLRGAETCREPLPAEPTLRGESSPPPQVTRPADPPQRIPAWPLIAIALVAGGLPMLWVFRDRLPPPKPWQASPELLHPLPAQSLPPPAPAVAPVASPQAAASPNACPGAPPDQGTCPPAANPP